MNPIQHVKQIRVRYDQDGLIVLACKGCNDEVIFTSQAREDVSMMQLSSASTYHVTPRDPFGE